MFADSAVSEVFGWYDSEVCGVWHEEDSQLDLHTDELHTLKCFEL